MAFTISGLSEAIQELEDLPRHIAEDCFPDALAAGGAVIERELIARTPRAEQLPSSAKKVGRLADDIDTNVTVNSSKLTGSAAVGFSAKTSEIVLAVEYGHLEVSRRGRRSGRVSAHPFMRSALARSEEQAVDAFVETLAQKI